jgi:truncated hemoglobin YjbI/quinol monooxygenase YgiN
MIVEYVRYKVAPDRAAALEEAYRSASAALEASPHCLGYELARSKEEPGRYILRIMWDSAEGHLEGFRKSEVFATFLQHVRPFISDLEEMIHYAPTGIERRGSIYDAAGGVQTFLALARAMHEGMKADALLGPRFAKAAESHVPHLAMWLTEVFGGPRLYSETHGDIALILRRHANLAISDDERDRFVIIAAAAAERVVRDPAARAAIGRYIAWGARIAQQNAAPEHVPDPKAGVPTWSWADR